MFRNTYSGPGGGTRHLHGDGLGFDAYGKVAFLLEVIFRKKIKRSAESTTRSVGAGLMGAGALMGLMAAMVPAKGSFGSVSRRETFAATAAC